MQTGLCVCFVNNPVFTSSCITRNEDAGMLPLTVQWQLQQKRAPKKAASSLVHVNFRWFFFVASYKVSPQVCWPSSMRLLGVLRSQKLRYNQNHSISTVRHLTNSSVLSSRYTSLRDCLRMRFELLKEFICDSSMSDPKPMLASVDCSRVSLRSAR